MPVPIDCCLSHFTIAAVVVVAATASAAADDYDDDDDDDNAFNRKLKYTIRSFSQLLIYIPIKLNLMMHSTVYPFYLSKRQFISHSIQSIDKINGKTK